MNKKLIIKESEWGMGHLCSLTDGKKCCLGFWAEQIGNESVFNENAKGAPDWKYLPTTFAVQDWHGENVKDPHSLESLTHGPSDQSSGKELMVALSNINDSESLSVEEKKRLITQGFAQIDIDVEFVP